MALSNEQWLKRMLDNYAADFKYRAKMNALYESQQPAVSVLDRYKDAYVRLLALSRTPWGRLVVDVTAERLSVIGFTGTDNDEVLWDVLRANRIEAIQKQVHTEALAVGTSYVSVWSDGDDDDRSIAFESSMTVSHEIVPGDPHKVAAAVKVWHDSIEKRYRANLYLPDEIIKYQSEDTVKDPQTWLVAGKLSDKAWEPIEEFDNPSGVVTMIPFVTRPNWLGYGRSDLSELKPIIDRIENITLNTMLATELGAFAQKWATGLEIPQVEDEDGNVTDVEPFKVALDRLWTSEDPETKFGQFQATDIRPYLSAVSDAVGQLSAVSRVPATYFVQADLTNPPSASSLEASETGLIHKVKTRMDRFGESWEEVAKFLGGSSAAGATTLWKDPRTQSDAQTVDAAVKLMSIQVPWKTVMAYLGYTPSQIKTMEAERAADTFNRLLNSSLPQATPLEFEQPASAEQ